MNAGARAKDLVKQILAFSRQTDHEMKPLRADILVKEVTQLMKSTLPAYIRIEKSIETTGEIMADPTHIHQVLMNLCTNAYHAMHADGGTLRIKLSAVSLPSEASPPVPEMLPGDYIQITVADTGSGIPAELLERIFEPYFTTKEKDKGTGLGLAVVHGIVASHNGHITVKSETGRGTTFNVYFPAIKRKQQITVQPEKIDLPGGNERILFVDDESAIVKVNKTRLERLGYHVTGVSSSKDALALFENRPDAFDLVITDMTMPEMSGEGLARNCLRIRPEMPVILCTGYSDIITEARAREIGIKEYVLKPILIQDLAAAIRRAVGKNNGE
jgi:CheY-like chemotaxis protein